MLFKAIRLSLICPSHCLSSMHKLFRHLVMRQRHPNIQMAPTSKKKKKVRVCVITAAMQAAVTKKVQNDLDPPNRGRVKRHTRTNINVWEATFYSTPAGRGHLLNSCESWLLKGFLPWAVTSLRCLWLPLLRPCWISSHWSSQRGRALAFMIEGNGRDIESITPYSIRSCSCHCLMKSP